MESTKKEGESGIRHCAFCLILCGFPTKLCGGCKKRAYCSKECQRADWSVKGNGQRHISWCRRHEHGEEDVDWEVVPIPNKGLGIKAKKLIPAGFKIIVEPVFSSPNDHSGIKDLEPKSGSLNEKFTKNVLKADNFEARGTVALRIARVNHACQPNAAAIYDETARVAILFSQKDIQPGEEISICYYAAIFLLTPENISGLRTEKEFHGRKIHLASEYGITCSTNCSCHDPTILALIKEGRKLVTMYTALAYQCRIEEALTAGDKLLDIYRRLNVSWAYRGIATFDLFGVAVMKSEFLPRAMEYIRSAAELFGKICPYSEDSTKKFKKMFQHPEMHPNYMKIDKEQAMYNVTENVLSGINL